MNSKPKTEQDEREDETEQSSYYYDDAHGYEDYDADKDVDEVELED